MKYIWIADSFCYDPVTLLKGIAVNIYNISFFFLRLLFCFFDAVAISPCIIC